MEAWIRRAAALSALAFAALSAPAAEAGSPAGAEVAAVDDAARASSAAESRGAETPARAGGDRASSPDAPPVWAQRPWPWDDTPRLSAGAFLGAGHFSRSLRLGRPETRAETPGAAPLIGIRAGYLLVPHLLKGTATRPRLHLELEARLAISSTRGDAAAERASDFAPIVGARGQARVDFWPDELLSPFATLGLGLDARFSRSPHTASAHADPLALWGVGAEYEVAEGASARVDLRQGVAPARGGGLTTTYEVHAGAHVRFGPPAHPRVGRRIFAEASPADAEPLRSPLAERDGEASGTSGPDGRSAGAGEEGIPGGAAAGDDRPRGSGIGDTSAPAISTPGGAEAQNGEAPAAEDGVDGRGEGDAELETIARELEDLARELRFERESADPGPGGSESLREIASILRENPEIEVEISGHTEAGKPRSHSLLISSARARRVAQHLIDAGIDEDRLHTVGRGADEPIRDHSDGEDGARDRRVEIHPLAPSS